MAVVGIALATVASNAGVEVTNVTTISGSTRGPLAVADDGNFYGATISGGGGTLYRVSTTGSYTNFHTLSLSNGVQPFGGLYGNGRSFYGSTSQGGANGDGTIFCVTTNLNFVKVFDYNHNTVGGGSLAPPLLLNDILYFTTTGGGTNNVGGIGAVSTNGTLLGWHSFNSTTHGSLCRSRPVQGTNGLLYVTLQTGSTYGAGAIVSFSPNPTNMAPTLVVAFTNGIDGGYPGTTLTLMDDGRLYGTSGGTYPRMYKLNENNTINTQVIMDEAGSLTQVTAGPTGSRAIFLVFNYGGEVELLRYTREDNSLVELGEMDAVPPADIACNALAVGMDNNLYTVKVYTPQHFVRLSVPLTPNITKVKNVNLGTNEITLVTVAGQEYTLKATSSLATGFTNSFTFTATSGVSVVVDTQAWPKQFYRAFVDAEGESTEYFSGMVKSTVKLATIFETIPWLDPNQGFGGGGDPGDITLPKQLDGPKRFYLKEVK